MPTKPAKAGSWPEPPPETMETFGFAETSGVGRRYMILLALSNAREGFVKVRDARAELTICVGSEKKCLAGGGRAEC